MKSGVEIEDITDKISKEADNDTGGVFIETKKRSTDNGLGLDKNLDHNSKIVMELEQEENKHMQSDGPENNLVSKNVLQAGTQMGTRLAL